MRRVLAAAVLALLVPAAVGAHVTIAPPFVEDGVQTEITFETPNERPPHATTSLAMTAPAGIAILSATAPAGWRATVAGPTVTWSGDRIENRATVAFPIRIVAHVRAGTYPFTAVQTYDDGAKVDWKSDLQVLPAPGATAPNQPPWGAIAASVTGLLVIVGSLFLVRILRRRSLQDR